MCIRDRQTGALDAAATDETAVGTVQIGESQATADVRRQERVIAAQATRSQHQIIRGIAADVERQWRDRIGDCLLYTSRCV